MRGSVSGKPLGRFFYDKQLDDEGRVVKCQVTVFPLAVKRQFKLWPEQAEREVEWFGASEAVDLVDDEGLRTLLADFSDKIAAKRKVASGAKSKDLATVDA